jgi:hypothetical protein
MTIKDNNNDDQKEALLAQLKSEHDQINDTLLDMISTLMREDLPKFKKLLKSFDEKAGQHFRFDEEAVYPSLVGIYYPGYLLKLYTDHDLAIARYNLLIDLFRKDNLTQSDFAEGIRHVRMISQYIAGCEILPIAKIPLNDDQIKRLKSIHKKSLSDNLGLTNWSGTQRNRKQLFFN